MSMKNTQLKRLPFVLSAALALVAFSGCATSQNATAPMAEAKPAVAASAPVTAPTQYYFLVFHENERIYPIADVKNYLAFMDVDELIYTRTRVGEGPNGETLVFGIEKKEAEDLSKPSKAEMIYDGKLEPADPFYAEVVKDGRYHVFGNAKDFKDYLVNKEITYTFTEVGTGPKGETVIYAMNKKTSEEGRPVKLIEAFSALRQAKK
jgi:hypothetical protein